MFVPYEDSPYNKLFDVECNKQESDFVAVEDNNCTIQIDEKGQIFDLARAFLSIQSMSNKKLQKLCYYAQAWHLALEDEPLINDCVFEAWVHGPVCPELYWQYREYGYDNIPVYEGNINNVSEEIKDFAKEVFDAYGELSGNELEVLSHSEAPWQNARGTLKPWERCNEKISEDDMKNYYRQQCKQDE